MTIQQARVKLTVLKEQEQELLRQMMALETERNSLLEGLCPTVFVNSTDHERALPSGDYLLVSEKPVDNLEFHASSGGVEVHTPDGIVDLEEWDPEAELIPWII